MIPSSVKLHRLPNLRPPDPIQHSLLAKLPNQLNPVLLKMILRLMMHRNKHISLDITEQPRRLAAAHGDLQTQV
jgi:hypothetical protein